MQVLFRPEDVEIARQAADLTVPQLGQGQVEQVVFSGAFERLRLRLPPLPGVRPIAPPVAFGDDTILVEATRQQDEIDRLPLRPGDRVWVGVRHIHALAHPGLQFLILSDGSPEAEAALALGAQMARLAHARAVILGYGLAGEAMERHLQQAKETLGSGLAGLEVRATSGPLAAALAREVERRPCDLVIMGYASKGGLDLAEEMLEAGEHHLLLVPRPQEVPERALICVTTGEPAKDDVLFAGRLVRHVGARATLMSILEPGMNGPVRQERTERFLAGGVRSLDVLGVPAEAVVRAGPVSQIVEQELASGGYDLLVLGTPLADLSGHISLRRGVVGQVMAVTPCCATLLVRSGQATVAEPATMALVRV